MKDAFVVAANKLWEDRFDEVVEAFMNVIEISVQVSASKSYVPKIGRYGKVISGYTELHVSDDIEAISVSVNGVRIAYLVEDLNESVKEEVLQELFGFYQNLNYNMEAFTGAILERTNAFNFMKYEA